MASFVCLARGGSAAPAARPSMPCPAWAELPGGGSHTPDRVALGHCQGTVPAPPLPSLRDFPPGILLSLEPAPSAAVPLPQQGTQRFPSSGTPAGWLCCRARQAGGGLNPLPALQESQKVAWCQSCSILKGRQNCSGCCPQVPPCISCTAVRTCPLWHHSPYS